MKMQSTGCDFFVDNFMEIDDDYNNGIFIEKMNLNKIHKII